MYIYICTHICAHVYMYVCGCVYICTYLYMYVDVDAYMYIFIYACVCVCICICVCVCICICVCVCICICVCVHLYIHIYVYTNPFFPVFISSSVCKNKSFLQPKLIGISFSLNSPGLYINVHMFIYKCADVHTHICVLIHICTHMYI